MIQIPQGIWSWANKEIHSSWNYLWPGQVWRILDKRKAQPTQENPQHAHTESNCAMLPPDAESDLRHYSDRTTTVPALVSFLSSQLGLRWGKDIFPASVPHLAFTTAICSAFPCTAYRHSTVPLKTTTRSGRAAATPYASSPPQASAQSGLAIWHHFRLHRGPMAILSDHWSHHRWQANSDPARPRRHLHCNTHFLQE
jgi:hypothetical protein